MRGVWLLVLAGCASLTPRPNETPAATCADVFARRFETAGEVEAKKALLRRLTNDDLICLLAEARKNAPLDDRFFVSDARRQSKHVQRFLGVNGLAFAREFEKQMLVASENGADKVFGYNVSGVGKFTQSPGLFRLDATGSGGAVLNYQPDFVALFGDGLSKQFSAWSEVQLIAVKNNANNGIFHDLEDTLFRVNDDVAVGVAERLDGSKRTVASYFIVLRLP